MKIIFKYSALLLFAVVVSIGVSTNDAAAQIPPRKKVIEKPRIEFVGQMTETTDYFGRKRFIGKVINREKERIDYIKIEFTIRNRVGEVLEVRESFINGQHHEFWDFEVSTSSLEPGKVGSFNVITSFMADSVYTYSFKLTGRHYIFK